MHAIRIHRFGGVDAIVLDDLPVPVPGPEEVLVRVVAAGVGPWDAWVREGRSVLPQPLPLILGSDVSGVVEQAGTGVSSLRIGDAVFGVTNARFTGGYAEYALATAEMLARKPARIGFEAAAAAPVVASTAWQMVMEHGGVGAGTRVLVHGGAGSVGAAAVQVARHAGAVVVATAFTSGVDYVRSLGADRVVDVSRERFEDAAGEVDVVVDTVGGDSLDRSFAVVRRGGIVVSAVATPNPDLAAAHGVRASFILVAVTTAGLEKVASLIDAGALSVRVGEVLPLAEARTAHEMLAGRPHRPGKIVLRARPVVERSALLP